MATGAPNPATPSSSAPKQKPMAINTTRRSLGRCRINQARKASKRPEATATCRWWRAAPAPGCRAARCRTAGRDAVELAKFNRIVAEDRPPAARTATVQCGVRNLAISEAAAPHGLYYAPDPSSQIACTIGGNVAENSGGVHCLKYGLTLHNVLKVRGFTVEGEPVEFGSDALDAPGLDLLPWSSAAKGMLAVTTEVTVKLTPKPQLARCIMASFDDMRKAGDAVAA
jgi:FAD/FMN-containing dehydrogenase